MNRVDLFTIHHRHPGQQGQLLSRIASFFVVLLSTVLLSTMLLPTELQAATLTSAVDKQTVPANETFSLHITYDEDPDGAEIDAALLQQQFKIAARNKTSSIRIVNGQASRETTWYFELSPRTTGTLLIPSFSINNTFSEAIQITVTDAPKTVTNTSKRIYSEVVVDKNEVQVQEQLIVAWRLVSTLPISNPVMEMPVIDNVLVHDLGARQYQRSSVDGKVEVVLEQRYAFFPQQSGTLEIPPQQFQFLVNTQRRFQTGLTHTAQEKRRIRTDSQRITVLPADASNNRQWLPASGLEIAQDIQGLSQDGKATAGEAFTRVITMRALGLMAEQLPAPPFDAANFKVYTGKPELRNDNNEKGVYGIRTDRVTMIPAKDGSLTLPALAVTWFNLATRQWETTTLPEQTLVVLPAKGTNAAKETTGSAQPTDESAKPSVNGTSAPHTAPTPFQWPRKLLAIIAVLAVGIILLLVRMFMLQRKLENLLSTGKLPASPMKPLTASVNQEALADAAKHGDTTAFYKSVLDWGRLHWFDNPPHTLADIAARVDNPDLRLQLVALDTSLYGNQQTAPPSLPEIASALQLYGQHHIANKGKPASTDTRQLEELYQN